MFLYNSRVFSTYVLSAWYIAAAIILFQDLPAWNTTTPLPDMAPAAFVVVPFVFVLNACSVAMLVGE